MPLTQLVKDKLNDLHEKIRITEKLDEAVDFAQRLMPEAHIWIDYEVNVNWPVKSMDEVKAVLKLFAENKCLLKSFHESEATPCWRLNYSGKIIRLCPEWIKEENNVEGATCRLVKVGEETVVYPRYKLVCEEKEESNDE